MLRTRVGVLRGGPSVEYDVSLLSGTNVIKNIDDEKYNPIDIFIDKEGNWNRNGVPTNPEKALRDIDVAFNALHGAYGEDGKLQQLLDILRVPYTGSSAIVSASAMNKIIAKRMFAIAGVKTPKHIELGITHELESRLVDIFRTMPMPLVVKPHNAGSSLGVSLVFSFAELKEAVANAFEYSPKIMIEEFIDGKEATVGVIENFRNESHYSLLPIEIVTPKKEIFSYSTKYSGETEEICPGRFSKDEMRELGNIAKMAHNALGARHYSRADMIISPRRGLYLLELNTLPGLTENSLIPKSLSAVGVKFPDFLDHVLTLALGR